jgi:hypothetical protein
MIHGTIFDVLQRKGDIWRRFQCMPNYSTRSLQFLFGQSLKTNGRSAKQISMKEDADEESDNSEKSSTTVVSTLTGQCRPATVSINKNEGAAKRNAEEEHSIDSAKKIKVFERREDETHSFLVSNTLSFQTFKKKVVLKITKP